MRAKRAYQMSIYETFAKHEIGQELKAISDWLDQHVAVFDWAEKDIQRQGIKATGRSGMSIEALLRCGLLKQHQPATRTADEMGKLLPRSLHATTLQTSGFAEGGVNRALTISTQYDYYPSSNSII